MEKEFTPTYINRLMGHLDSCKDVCDHFGIETVLIPYIQGANIVGFTSKSYRKDKKEGEDDEPQFEYDPFWDEDEIGDYSGVDEEEDGSAASKYPEIVNKIPDDDEEIIDITKKWVGKLMSDMG
jgi:hypothetical protein